MQIPIYG
jgi:hypothetical protein